ncbi:copper resistance protein CopC [Micromonospora sp. NPDC000089]|uniref:copper resistance CopC family protein n=1 Tax=unclassified Micromonospora TaxID=2617518 RepID=UPI0036CFE551
MSLLSAGPAYAHNSLTGSNPADGARVAAAPARIELRFLAAPNPATTTVTVMGPDNVPAVGGPPRVTGDRVHVPFRPGKAGLYIVGYRVASSDGHPVKGEVRFTLTTGTAAQPPTPAATPPATPPPTPPATPTAAGTQATAAPGAGSSTPAGSASAVPVAGRDEGGRGWLWVVGALVVLAALAAGLLLRRRRSSPR